MLVSCGGIGLIIGMYFFSFRYGMAGLIGSIVALLAMASFFS